MSAPDTTKFQINYKLQDGTLINLYATDAKELETGLTDLSMIASLIKSTGAELGGSATASAVANLQAAGLNPVAVTPSGAPAQQAGNSCKHGAMVWKEGVSPKGPWRAWMCPAPKGASDKCEAIWVR
jgi:hypothetical protein